MPAPPHLAAPGAPPRDPGHITIAGRKISYDAIWIGAAGLLGALFLFKGVGQPKGGGATGATVLQYQPAAGLGGTDPTLAGGLTAPPLASGPVAGPDYSSYVSGLYQQYTGRTADASGLAYWTGVAQAQGPVAAAQGISSSPEAEVVSAYENILGRSPDPAGEQYWIGRVQSGLSLAQLDQAFLSSQEYATAHPALVA